MLPAVVSLCVPRIRGDCAAGSYAPDLLTLAEGVRVGHDLPPAFFVLFIAFGAWMCSVSCEVIRFARGVSLIFTELKRLPPSRLNAYHLFFFKRLHPLR